MGILSSLFGQREGAIAPAATPPADAYTALREQVLGLTADAVDLPTGTNAPLAVLMETGYEKAVATLVAVADGTVSMYFSNGGGVIGAGAHAPVRAAAGTFLDAAKDFADEMPVADGHPLPGLGHVRFSVVMDGAVRAIEAIEDDLGHARHAIAPLFHQGHQVIAAIRESTPEG